MNFKREMKISKNALPYGAGLCLFLLNFGAPVLMSAADNADESINYQSPYSVKFSIPEEQLYQVDKVPPRENPRLESDTPFEEWHSEQVHRKYGKWGPGQKKYPAPANYGQLSAEWKRERVIAVALKNVGLSYQHHHIPEFKPREGKRGLDCSNFSSWAYNYGLGIKINSDVSKQADQSEVPGAGGEGTIAFTMIRDEHGYDELISKLKPADLLYIRGKSGAVTHVIMWVGELGVSPDHVPLVIDSTGPEHRDCQGNQIPGGIHLRPFPKNSWYYKSFDHAHRIIN